MPHVRWNLGTFDRLWPPEENDDWTKIVLQVRCFETDRPLEVHEAPDQQSYPNHAARAAGFGYVTGFAVRFFSVYS